MANFYVIYALLLLIGVITLLPPVNAISFFKRRPSVICVLEARALVFGKGPIVWDYEYLGLIFLGTYCYKGLYILGLIIRDIWLGYFRFIYRYIN